MRNIKLYADEVLSTEDGDYTYLHSFIDYFEKKGNAKLEYHTHYISTSKLKLLVRSLIRVSKDLNFEFAVFKSEYESEVR